MIETPKNLTRNILLGMFLGFVVGSFFITRFFPESLLKFLKVYVLILEAHFYKSIKAVNCSISILFSCIWYLISYKHAKFRNITLKTIALSYQPQLLLYLFHY
jgi:hypothetical protein